MAERVSPHSIEAERSVLGAIMVRSDALADVVDTLASTDFFRDAHRRIYEAMVAVWKAGTEIDLVTLKNELNRRRDLEEIGGPAYLTGLTDGVPRTTNISHYAAIVKEKAQLRDLIARAHRIVARAYLEEDTVDTLVEQGESALREIAQRNVQGEFVTGSELAQRVYATIEGWQAKRGKTGIATGFDDLDEMTTGFQPGDLIILAARPSMGKSALALQIAHHVGVTQQLPVAVFALEMSTDSVGVRMVCCSHRIDAFKARKGWLTDHDMFRLTQALMPLEDGKIFIDDGMTVRVADIRRKCRQLQAQHGLSLLIVDYLQLMDPPADGRRGASRNEDVSAISRGLKVLGKELHVPVVALSQLNRRLESRPDKRPMMSDLRDSGALEQDADLIAFLFREAVYDERPDNLHLAELIVAKQRNGPLGTVHLHWSPAYTRFDNVADGVEPVQETLPS